MIQSTIVTLAVFLSTGAAGAVADTDDAGAADLQKMQGDWMVASMKIDGAEVPAGDAQALFRTVEGDRVTVSRYSKAVSRATIRLDATQSPKTIDSIPDAPAAGKAAPQPIRGIYEFDGAKLRICNARAGQPRPKNFDAKQFTGHSLFVWEPEVK